jgi:hypothetical protein
LDHGLFDFGWCAVMLGIGCLDMGTLDNSGHTFLLEKLKNKKTAGKLFCSHMEIDHIYIANIMGVKIFYENSKFNESFLVATVDSN